MKIQIYLFITIAVAILLLSCGPQDDTTPSSQSGSQSVSIGFSLAQGANPLSLTNALVYSTNAYVLTITNSSSQLVNSKSYKITQDPLNALIIVATTSNTVSFRVANADLGSVKLTATHTNDNTLTREVTLTLTKAEYSASEIPIVYSPTNTISTNDTYTVSPTNIGNLAKFSPQYPLSVRVSPTSSASIANDGRVSLTTGASVSTNLVSVTFSSSNYVDYTTNFYVQVHHSPVARAVLSLSSGTAPLTFGAGNYIVAANLTNSDGSKVAGIAEDFRFTATPPGAIVGISSNANSYTFAVTNASYGSVTINAINKQRNTLSAGQNFTLAKASYPSGIVPIAYSASNFAVSLPSAPGSISPSSYDRANYYPQSLTLSRVSGPDTYSFNASGGETTFTAGGNYEFQVTFSSSNYATYTTPKFAVTVEQLTRFGQVVQGGSIPNLTSEADELTRTVLTPLGVATGGTLVARYATESGAGLQNGTSWANAWAATDLRGGINGISDASATKAYVVLIASGTYKPTDGTDRDISFSMKNRTAIVGGFTNTGGWERSGTTVFSGDIGNANDSDNSYHVFRHKNINLYNALLYGVTITKGNASGSSVFSLNPLSSGGGMYNASDKVLSTTLMKVVFSNNSADFGGGLFNKNSSPVLTGVVFTGNRAIFGGGMFNYSDSAPVLVGAVFSKNSARRGGAMYNDNNSFTVGPLIVNTIFAENNLTTGGKGRDIVMELDSSRGETIRIAGSVLGIGLASPTNGIVVTTTDGSQGSYNITHHSLANGAVNFGADASTSATGGLTYPTIQSTSSAVDIGLYVRKGGSTYYFSDDETTWYTAFTATGGFDSNSTATVPNDAENLTATDIAGNARVGRPDAGVSEYTP